MEMAGGPAARDGKNCWAQEGCGSSPTHGESLPGNRYQGSDPLCLFDRKLAPAFWRSQSPHAPAGGIPSLGNSGDAWKWHPFDNHRDTEALKKPMKTILKETIAKTAHNHDMILNLALNYGGRDEIVGAVKDLLNDIRRGTLADQDVTKDLFSRYLDTADLPDPDLLIRTSGEYRISNFLLWQSAYTEFYFTEVLWPDFNRDELFGRSPSISAGSDGSVSPVIRFTGADKNDVSS